MTLPRRTLTILLLVLLPGRAELKGSGPFSRSDTPAGALG
jgi:hypothetical protein